LLHLCQFASDFFLNGRFFAAVFAKDDSKERRVSKEGRFSRKADNN